MAKTYRKTATIDAEQYHAAAAGLGLTTPFVDALCFAGHGVAAEAYSDSVPHIHTLEGNHKVTDHDWIARGVKGEFWPIKDDIFRATYTLADPDEGERQ